MKLHLLNPTFLLFAIIIGFNHCYASRTEVGPLSYELNKNDKTATVIGWSSKATDNDKSILRIPSTVNSFLSQYTVTQIGQGAFQEQEQGPFKLVSVHIPQSIQIIGAHAFKNCQVLESIQFEDNSSLTEINAHAFEQCIKIQSLNFPSSLKDLGSGAFEECFSLSSLDLSNTSIQNIRTEAFLNCHHLSSVKFPGTLKEIGSSAFKFCNELTGYLDFPSSIKIIREDAFRSTGNIQRVLVPGEIEYIGDGCFSNSGIERFSLRRNSGRYEGTLIGKGAFANCASLAKVDLPFGIINMPERLFEGCSNLQEVSLNINTNLKGIGNYAFLNCVNLNNINFPASINSIGGGAFKNCGKLSQVNFALPSALESIGESAFEDCGAINSIALPNAVRYIKSSAFSNCQSLQSINLENLTKLGSIADKCFSNCKTLQKIVLGPEVANIGNGAFQNCSSLSIVDSQNNTKLYMIGDEAFSLCSSLKEVKFPSTVQRIGKFAFSNCKMLEKCSEFPALFEIGSCAFQCTNLSSFMFPTGVSVISEGVLRLCPKLTTIEIYCNSKNGCSIGAFAFEACPELQKVIMPANIRAIRDHVNDRITWFDNCGKLRDIILVGTQPSSDIQDIDFSEFVFTSGGINNFYDDVTLYFPKLWDGVNFHQPWINFFHRFPYSCEEPTVSGQLSLQNERPITKDMFTDIRSDNKISAVGKINIGGKLIMKPLR